MSDVNLRITLECEVYRGIAWAAWQASRAAIEIELPKSTYQRTEVQAIAEHTLHKLEKPFSPKV